MKRNEGFTMVELLVAMVVGSIVTLAATSVLLLGLRYNSISIGAAQRQNTTRIIMSLLEGVASEGTITGVETTLQSWKVLGKDGHVILSYKAEDRAIFSGGKEDGENSSDGTKMLEDVIASHISMTEQGLLTVSMETEDGSYVSSVYCRNHEKPENVTDDDTLTDTEDEVIEDIGQAVTEGKLTGTTKDFIDILLTQYRLANGVANPGVIVYTDEYGKPTDTGQYYAQWYADKDNNGTKVPGWDSSTPWCACYISWALCESGIASGVENHPKWYANVDEFMLHFKNGNSWLEKSNVAAVEAGDLVFFDWEGGSDPEHVGVVLLKSVDETTGEGFIYTIEGNSAGLVAMRMYSTSDPAIIGYGTLNFSNTNQAINPEMQKNEILEKIQSKLTDSLFQDEELDDLAQLRAKERLNNPNLSSEWIYEGSHTWQARDEFYCKYSEIDEEIDSWLKHDDNPSSLATHYGVGIYETYIVVLYAGP